MKLSVPPHIAWPAFVVLLLLIGVGSAFSALWAARSDGGVEAVRDYYQHAVRWVEEAAQRSESARLGWSLSAHVSPAGEDGLSRLELTIRDSGGQPVSGLQGTVRLLRPQSVEAVAELPLVESPSDPGVYSQQAPIIGAGLWDFEVVAQKDTLRYGDSVRLDLP